jgi:hypothetical protein
MRGTKSRVSVLLDMEPTELHDISDHLPLVIGESRVAYLPLPAADASLPSP